MSPAPLSFRTERIHTPTLVSMVLAGLLAFVALVRVLSYNRSFFAYWIEQSPLAVFAYQPDSVFSVRYFKILATPSFVSLIYFIFRIFNRGHRNVFPPGYASHHEPLDFRSPWLRLVLLALINVHWLVQEGYKFATKGFPYSPLESWQVNACMLALSGLIAFFGMKWMSFEPLLEPTPSHETHES